MNIERALECARLSRAVYSWDMWCHFIDDNYNNYRHKKVDVDNHEAGILLHKGVMTIVIRGTDDISDAMTDLNIIPKMFPYLKGNYVHSGFLTATKKIWRSIEPYFSSDGEVFDYECINQIIVTGHSLGGAVATLLASIIEFEYDRSVDVYTFGSPRVLTDNAAKTFNKRHINYCRFVNNNDIVPKAPFNSLMWEHVGTRYYINSNGKIFEGKEIGFWSKLWDSVVGRVKSLLNFKADGFDDHSIGNYVNKLKLSIK